MINLKIKNQDSIYLKDFYQNILIVNGVMQNLKCQAMIIVRNRLVLLIRKGLIWLLLAAKETII